MNLYLIKNFRYFKLYLNYLYKKKSYNNQSEFILKCYYIYKCIIKFLTFFYFHSFEFVFFYFFDINNNNLNNNN